MHEPGSGAPESSPQLRTSPASKVTFKDLLKALIEF